MNCLRHELSYGHFGRELKTDKTKDMKENKLVILSKEFAVDIVTVCADIQENRRYNVLVNQLLRSGTSVGANIHEANYAASRADFTNKLQIALKECYETDYWLDLFKDSKLMSQEKFERLHSQCSKIRRLLIVSINTTKASE